ncbi:MAG TPA: hypothetical protein VK853_10400 [Ilumatobacteraceae bacterium]|nr:hypothetical protein [Ilumatobacteraceae bacterium]
MDVVASPITGMSPTDRIELIVPLRAEFGATIRTLAASVGADLGMSVDELDDLRLAVSEVFSVLVDAAADLDERARVSFAAPDGHLTATIGCDGTPLPTELDELAENILRSVTDGFEVEATGITFVKRGIERSGDQRRP